MVNTESNGNGVVGGNGNPCYVKQLPDTLKKTALKDVHNGNVGSIHKQQENTIFGGGRTSGDAIKVCRTKRMTPEFPSHSPGLASVANNGANENVMNARVRFQLELDRGRVQKMEKYIDSTQSRNMGQSSQEIPQKKAQLKETHVHRAPADQSNHNPLALSLSSGGPSLPSSLGQLISNPQSTESNSHAVCSEIPPKNGSMSADDQLRTERFIHLQQYLKQCDEANQIEYIKTLLPLSPTELSKHAVELEKRAIQLSIEEAKEMQRMKALNILGKSAPVNNEPPSTQLSHPRK